MTHHSRTLGLSRSAVAMLLCALGLAVAPPLAAAAVGTFVIGGSSLYPASAVAQQNYYKDGIKDVKCASGTYMHYVYVVPGTWGTYPTVAGIGFQCIGPDKSEPHPSWFGSDDYALASGCGKNGEDIFGPLTGLNVNVDRYVKDLKARCGSISTSGDVTDLGYPGDWAIGEVQDDDTKTALTCATGDVVTGLRIGYKQKSNGAYGFTSVWLWCAGVGPAPSTSDETTSAKRPADIVKKPLPKPPLPATKAPRVTTPTTPRPAAKAPRVTTPTTPRPAAKAPRVTTPTTPKRPGTATVKR